MAGANRDEAIDTYMLIGTIVLFDIAIKFVSCVVSPPLYFLSGLWILCQERGTVVAFGSKLHLPLFVVVL